ncbi:shikimate dehydrogenase [Bradyrhizobium sp.]|uniref:shikimate dehydrogenase n=1 Tax=Bradyrhizobium sp. TaxID=376 RepID=UPI001D34F30D|nr:shikimate dehydrogenase [Bradyrhizobium sp.]MBI5318291.1 shikimate dehydrogenase [Bradyrhizobium sp.]
MISKPSILVGLIGAGIQSSLSPAMHEREGAAQGLSYAYRLIDLDVLGLTSAALPDLLASAERQGFAGLNITFPCKQAVIEWLDELSPDARAIGAVNTVLFANGRRIGHNTDWSGFAESFRRALPDVRRERVVLLGAGGAGAAVAHALLSLQARELAIVDTDAGRARALADALCSRFGSGRAIAIDDAAAAMRGADGVVNATPVGMAKFPGLPLPAELLSPELFVSDIVYFPLETELLREARARGCRTMPGAGMAVFQAVEAFGLFSGRPADAERMRAHFAELTGRS